MTNPPEISTFIDDNSLVKPVEMDDLHGRSGETGQMDGAVHKIEIRATTVEKLGGPKEPMSVNLETKALNMNPETKLDQRVVTLRHLRERAVLKLQEGVAVAFREYLADQRCTEIHSPKIVAAGAKGGANIFKLDYFGKPAFLAQSPQFYKQFMVPVYSRVFEVGPVFRDANSLIILK